jgi:hypothetical protein
MAKASGPIVKLQGKIGDRVFIDSPKNGYHSREYVEPDPSNNSPEFNHNTQRTASMNDLASGLNSVVNHYCDNFKSKDFYESLKKRLWKEKLDNRYLLLLQLRRMDIHPSYPFDRLGGCRTTVTATRSRITVDMVTTSHPQRGQYQATDYYYEVILMLWSKNSSNKEIVHSRQRTETISLDRDNMLPEFEFQFTRPAGTVHWLLCLRQQLLVDDKNVEAFVGEAMQIIDAGTFDKKDEELLAKREADKVKEMAMRRNRKKEEEAVVVVKAKKKGGTAGEVKGKRKQ